jgi:Protein of unknown function (DUF1385)
MAPADEKIRLGGMALGNGVLVHGPHSWACAIRRPDGTIEVASARKHLLAARVKSPLLRGPARLFEALALLPQVKRKLPAAKLPMENPRVVASMIGASVTVRVLRTSRLRPVARELLSGFVSMAPAMLALRGGELASYHGAEHIAIGTYEYGKPATREHERCGGHLVGPLLLTSAIANTLAARAPEHSRRRVQAGAQIGAIAAATELFGWMTRHPENVLARALSKPGHALQHRYSTAEPTPEQLEVAEAALAACLELEQDAAADAANPPVKVKKARRNYVITGTAPDAENRNVVAVKITQKKIEVASVRKSTLPTADNGRAFKVVAKKSELPAGQYKLVFVHESKPKYIKLAFRIP